MSRNITSKKKEQLYIENEGVCQDCGKSLDGYWRPCTLFTKWGRQGKWVFVIDDGIIHHPILISEGGPDIISNRTLLCVDCHKIFHSKHVKDSYAQQVDAYA